MRLVKVQAPAGKALEVARVAHDAGIDKVTLRQEQVFYKDGREEMRDVVDVDTSTPAAKAFIDAVMAAPFFDPRTYSISVRQPRTVISHEQVPKLTWPVALPTTDILEDLWQFNHITWSLVTRVLIAGAFIAYGMLRANLLLIVAGLLFTPFLPLLLAMSFGLQTHHWPLARQGLLASATTVLLLVAGGAVVALLSSAPMKFQEFSSPLPGFVVSLGVGIAAAVATGDDTGRRELLGLAATAQTALVPVWFGIALVRGFGATTTTGSPSQRLLGFGINLVTIVVAAAAMYAVLRMRAAAVEKART